MDRRRVSSRGLSIDGEEGLKGTYVLYANGAYSNIFAEGETFVVPRLGTHTREDGDFLLGKVNDDSVAGRMLGLPCEDCGLQCG